MKTIKFLQTLLAAIFFLGAAAWQTTLADQAACMPLKYEQVTGGDGNTVAFNAVPLFPNAVPLKPIPEFPLNPLVVEGNDGQFVPLGSNATHLEIARFQWRPGVVTGGSSFRFPFGPVFQLGLTTHYEICLYQKSSEKRCEDDIAASGDNNGNGFLKMYESCSAEIHLANGKRGVAPSGASINKFQPRKDPSVGEQIFEIFWKMRACNLDKCSDWTDPVSLFWVPPPVLRDPTFTTTPNSILTTPGNPNSDFPVTFIWEPAGGIRTGPSYVAPTARLCIASPGERCPSGGSTSPNAASDPWVLWVNVPNNALGGVAITGTVRYYDRNAHIFGFAGQTVHWTAANCWALPSGSVVCVYNNNVKAVNFLP